MKKSILTALLITAASAVFAEPQTTCPVMGKKSTKSCM